MRPTGRRITGQYDPLVHSALARARAGFLLPAVFNATQGIDDQPAPAVFNGLIIAAFAFAPKSSGLVDFGFQWTGHGSAADNVTLEAVLFQGATLAGGTVESGIRFPIGSLVTVTGGSAISFLAFQSSCASGPVGAGVFAGGVAAVGMAQLTPGQAYQVRIEAVGLVAGVNYTSQFVGAFMREVQ